MDNFEVNKIIKLIKAALNLAKNPKSDKYDEITVIHKLSEAIYTYCAQLCKVYVYLKNDNCFPKFYKTFNRIYFIILKYINAKKDEDRAYFASQILALLPALEKTNYKAYLKERNTQLINCTYYSNFSIMAYTALVIYANKFHKTVNFINIMRNTSFPINIHNYFLCFSNIKKNNLAPLVKTFRIGNISRFSVPFNFHNFITECLEETAKKYKKAFVFCNSIIVRDNYNGYPIVTYTKVVLEKLKKYNSTYNYY